MTYTIPSLTAGSNYTVRLDFVEYAFNAAGKRVFNVSINGTQVLSKFDIFVAAGGEFIGVAEQFTAAASSSGTITITFTSVVNNSMINGIEVYTDPAPPAVHMPAILTLTRSGPAKVDDIMPLIDGGKASPVNVSNSSSGFFSQLANSHVDFGIQGAGNTALGTTGGSTGGISTSLAIKFDLYKNQVEDADFLLPGWWIGAGMRKPVHGGQST
jgi:hypothetical protein